MRARKGEGRSTLRASASKSIYLSLCLNPYRSHVSCMFHKESMEMPLNLVRVTSARLAKMAAYTRTSHTEE